MALTTPAFALTAVNGRDTSLFMKMVPADAPIADLQKKAAEYEETAKTNRTEPCEYDPMIW